MLMVSDLQPYERAGTVKYRNSFAIKMLIFLGQTV